MPRSTRRNTKSHKNTRGHKNLSMTRPKRGGKKSVKRRTSKKNRTRRFKKRGGMEPDEREPDERERRLLADLYDPEGNPYNLDYAERIAEYQFQKKLGELRADAKSKGETEDQIARLEAIAEKNRKIMQGAHLTDKFEDPKKEMATPGDRRQPKTGSLAQRKK